MPFSTPPDVVRFAAPERPSFDTLAMAFRRWPGPGMILGVTHHCVCLLRNRQECSQPGKAVARGEARASRQQQQHRTVLHLLLFCFHVWSGSSARPFFRLALWPHPIAASTTAQHRSPQPASSTNPVIAPPALSRLARHRVAASEQLQTAEWRRAIHYMLLLA